MKQQLFELQYNRDWEQLEALLSSHDRSRASAKKKAREQSGTREAQTGQSESTQPDTDAAQTRETVTALPRLYRRLCHHLALAKQRRYSQHLIDRLNDLTMRCHHLLYYNNTRFRHQLLHFVVLGFPQALRANATFVWLSAVLFAGPLLAVGALCYVNEDMIYSIASRADVRQYESMYDKDAEHFGRNRDSGDDVIMFGFYIKNNIGISFQMFAGGILFGLGSIFFLIFNGIHIGAVAGYMAKAGFTETFFPFVVGHGAFELTALVFSGAAGLKLGFALVDPGPCTRLTALRLAGRQSIQIIYGSTLMLVIAAFLEAFWSSSTTTTPSVKYAVGGLLWVLVIAYCFYGGQRKTAPGINDAVTDKGLGTDNGLREDSAGTQHKGKRYGPEPY